MLKKYGIAAILVALFLGAHSSPEAQIANPRELFRWSATLQPATVAPGERTVIQASLDMPPGHFIYRNMTSFQVAAEPVIQAASAIFPSAETVKDPFDGKPKEVYQGKTTFQIPLQVASHAASGTHTIELAIRYQGCSPEVCFLPLREKLTLNLNVHRPDRALEPGTTTQRDFPLPGGSPTTSGYEPVGQKTASTTFASALERSFLWAVLVVFVAGVATSFTPCVYPLIPITISLFGARQATRRLTALALSGTYVLGIATMYSALGLVAAASGAVFGQFMTNRWLVSLVALVFVIFGISMLGAFEIQLPAGLQKRISQTRGTGFAGAYVMGLFGGIVAAPCTGPVLGAVLAYVAKTQNLLVGFTLLFTFALGLGLLFLVLGTYSGLITRLPKSGSWMDGVKSAFAIVLFAFALYFMKDAFPVLKVALSHSAFVFLIAAGLMVAGIVLGAIHQSFSSPSPLVRLSKAVGVVLVTVGLFITIGSLAQGPKSLESPDWVYDLEAGLQQGRQLGKPVMVDFWAEWCAACKELDRLTYANAEVRQRLKDFVTVKIDADRYPGMDKIAEQYSIVGLPTVLFFDSQGRLRPEKTLVGFVNARAFLEHIRDLS